MKKAGLGTALLFGSVYQEGLTGDVSAMSDEWWELLKYAIRRAGEEGIDIGLFNGLGWSQSGGPWIPDEKSMRHLVTRELQVSGPGIVSTTLPQPESFYQDVRVLAFPTPDKDTLCIRKERATISGSPNKSGLNTLLDGDHTTAFEFPESALESGGDYVINILCSEPFEARSMMIHPTDNQFIVSCELLARTKGGQFEYIRKFEFQRPPGGDMMDIGPLWNGPGTIAFPVIRSRHFKLRFSNFRYHEFFGRAGSQPGLREIELSGAYRIDHYVEKQLSKVFPMPLPMWDDYLWDKPDPVEYPALMIPEDKVTDISKYLKDGTLEWKIPEGNWTILRISMVSTGSKSAPVMPHAEGPEVDKLSREHAAHHFDGFAGRLIREMPEMDRKAIKYYVIDSYEKGSQNWSDDLEIPFRERYGYDPIPYLPVFTGRVVGSAEQSERFMWDLRRLVADRVSFEYVGGLREIANKHGWQLWLENYGHWGFPGEFLQYGGKADLVSGEFWTQGTLGSIELRAAASSAHTYGKKVIFAESFTSSAPHFLSHPWMLKQRGDWSFTEGVNHTLLTEYLHQPNSDRLPGVNAWFGTAFNRNNTWFFKMDSWITYLKRCNFMLRQGNYVADLAYFIGEDAPKMTGIRDPEVPPGYSYDYINGDVILESMQVQNGRLTLPDGMSYRVLVLPPLDNMRPELLQKIRDLVKAGGNIYGSPPDHSPSLENYPEADEQVKALAHEIWQNCDGNHKTSSQLGKGLVYDGVALDRVLEELDTPPDLQLEGHPEILWIHRKTDQEEIYFLTNQSENRVWIDPVFRVRDLQPECWDAVTGTIRNTSLFENLPHGTRVPLELGPRASVFVVFRDGARNKDPLKQIRRDNQEIRIPVSVTSQDIQMEVSENGDYTLVSTEGNVHNILVNDIPESLPVNEPWMVHFTHGWGAPDSVLFEELMDWTESEDTGIKYYSGTANYTNLIEIQEDYFTKNLQLILDLGAVGDIATVMINGKQLGNFWHHPIEIDVSRGLKPGINKIRIGVTNTWRNRLIGDAAEPEQARTWLSTDLELNGDEELMPAGLIGPVRIKVQKVVSFKN